MLALKKILRRNDLSPFFRFSQKGNIWRMFFTEAGHIAGETRDPISKNVYFFAMDSVNGKVLFKELQLKEKWWVSISGINLEMVFVSGYKKPDMPEQLGITAVDLLDGSIRWARNDLTFFFADNEHVYVCKQLFETKKYYSIDAHTGSDSGEISLESILTLKSKTESKLYKDFVYPESLPAEDDLSGIIRNVKHEGPVEYIRFKNSIVYNYHEYKGIDTHDIHKKVLTNRLFVLDSDLNKLVLEETLNKNVSSYVPDSFFIRKDQLFYVKEKKELIAVKLS